jgi:hypothetical protein
MAFLHPFPRRAASGQRLADWTFIVFYGAMTSLFAWRLLHMRPANADEQVGFLQWDFWMGLVWLVASLAFVAVTWRRRTKAPAQPATDTA